MTPKFGMDKDGDIPPCGIMWDIKVLEKWEEYKNKKYGTSRKTPCSCRHFDGKVPSTHKCFKNNCFTWIKSLFIKTIFSRR